MIFLYDETITLFTTCKNEKKLSKVKIFLNNLSHLDKKTAIICDNLVTDYCCLKLETSGATAWRSAILD